MRRPPAGIRTPSWDFTPHTLGIIRDLGFVYDSSLMADDRPYELVSAGEPAGVVELPVEWLLDDHPYFQIDPARGSRPGIPPDAVYQIWQEEFEMACRGKTLFLLTMHPQVSRGRICAGAGRQSSIKRLLREGRALVQTASRSLVLFFLALPGGESPD